MTQIEIVEAPRLDGKRKAQVLTEDGVGHYPEFRAFFVRRIALDSNGLARPGYVQAPSGMVYALVFIRRSGEPFPDGIEIYATSDALEPLNEASVDSDLWALLRWMIEGVGDEWRVEDLDATGRLHQLTAAGTE